MSARKNKMSADSPTPTSSSSGTVSPSPTLGLTINSPNQAAKKTYGGRARRLGKGDELKISPQKDIETEEAMDDETEAREDLQTKVETPEPLLFIEELPSSSPKRAITEADKSIEPNNTISTTGVAEASVVDKVTAPISSTARNITGITTTKESVATTKSTKKKGRPKADKPQSLRMPMKRQIGTRNLGLKSPKLLPRRSLQDVKSKPKTGKLNRRATLNVVDKKPIKTDIEKKTPKIESDKKEVKSEKEIKTEKEIIKPEKEVKTEKDIKMEDVKNDVKIEAELKVKKETLRKETPSTSTVKRKGRPPKTETTERTKRKLEEMEIKSPTKRKKAKIELVSNIPSFESIVVPRVTGILSTSIEEIIKDVQSRLAPPVDQDHPETPSKCSETDTESISEKLSETCESVASQEDTKPILDDLNPIKNIKQEPSGGNLGDSETEPASKQKPLDKKPVRRSGRPRKNTLKEQEIPSPVKLVGKTEIKVEVTTADDTSRDSAMTSTNDDASQNTEDVAPLHIDTMSKSPKPSVGSQEKASSLSPLESEGVSEISVKQFYGEPAFLENNRGIEKDPKLGEIVQVQEKISFVQNVDENAVMDIENIDTTKDIVIKELSNEKDDFDFLKEDESLGEELKMDESIDEEMEEKLLNSDEDTQIKDIKVSDTKIDEKLEADLLKEECVRPKEMKNEDNNNLVIDEDQTTNCSEETAIVTEDNNEPAKNVENSVAKGETRILGADIVEIAKDVVVEEKKVAIEEKMEVVENKNDIEEMEKLQVEEDKLLAEDKNIILSKIDEKLLTEEKENINENQKSIVTATPLIISEIKMKSNDTTTNTVDVIETPESLKLKETHLKSLGLLTIKEADEKKEKQRQKEMMQSSSASSTSSTGSATSKSKSRNNNGKDKDKDKEEYTGTLKTVIKVPRQSNNNQNEKNKRLPLKMTFQKGRGKNGNEKDSRAPNQTGDEVYYTIQNEGEGHDTTTSATNHDGNIVSEQSESISGQEVKKALVIPEKASSFSIHPGRVCRDQCFYCGGKFGLFDTPCHVAQIKSLERQKKILDNEEKLTVDSCLCDACYRHVDRRANCPSYKKRLSAPGALSSIPHHISEQNRDNLSDQNLRTQSLQKQHLNHPKIMCRVTNCNQEATHHSLRRKWFLKMKKSIEKLINVNLEANQSHLIPICDNHYDAISHLMVCTLCKRKLPKNHIFYIYQEIDLLEKKLKELGIPVLLGTTPVVCKICRYFANLLLKPPEPRTQKAQFIKTYRSRLLQFRSIEVLETSDSDNNNQIPHKSPQHAPTKIKPKVPQLLNKTQKTPQKEPPFASQESFDGNSGHILLDNDVMVNYDVPMIELNTQSGQQKRPQPPIYGPKLPRYSNESSVEANNDMARILRANPNISMRELLPGEEDLGMYASIPFPNGKKTPEGWSKVQTVIQYDDVTKQMFEELQKPYGNQSSFLRHLVLLEKYFRNGDLVLSQNASYNAMSYSESVQTRLKSYDNVRTGGLSIMQQLSSPIQITPTVTMKPKPKSDPHNNNMLIKTPLVNPSFSRSSNNPIPSTSSHQFNTIKANRQISVTTDSNQHEILAAASKYIKLDETTIMPATKKSSGAIPPELISITKTNQPAIAITPISNRKSPGPNISTPPASISTATTPPVPTPSTSASISTCNVPSTSANSGGVKPSVPINQQQQQQQQQQLHNAFQQQQHKQIIKLPETLNANERKLTNGKPWRPTLIPITPGALNAQQQSGTLYQTADGRRLPSLIQVMSGGKPYHISIDDYNRMCILRREKLIQLQMSKEQNRNNNNNNTSGSSTNSSSNSGNGSGNTPSVHNSNKQSSSASDDSNNRNSISNLPTFVGANNKKLNIPNKILEQNSLIPVGSNKSSNGAVNERKRTKSGGNSSTTSVLKSHIPIAPKPPQLPNSTTVLAVSSSAAGMKSSQSPPQTLTITTTNQSSSNSTIITSTATVTLPPSIEMIKTTGGNSSWPNNLAMDQSMNGYTISTQSSGGTLLMDNSAVSVLSKIPKSLTVIPQQKGRSRVSSIEDLTSA